MSSKLKCVSPVPSIPCRQRLQPSSKSFGNCRDFPTTPRLLEILVFMVLSPPLRFFYSGRLHVQVAVWLPFYSSLNFPSGVFGQSWPIRRGRDSTCSFGTCPFFTMLLVAVNGGNEWTEDSCLEHRWFGPSRDHSNCFQFIFPRGAPRMARPPRSFNFPGFAFSPSLGASLGFLARPRV